MRKSTKILLILSGILAALGICLCVISVCMGMTFADLRRMVFEGEFTIYPFHWGDDDAASFEVDANDHGAYNKGSFDLSADSLTHVVVDLESASLDIKENPDDGQVSLELGSVDGDDFLWDYKEGRLVIYEEGDWTKSGRKATLYLPKDIHLTAADLQTDAGALTSDVPFSCDSLTLDVDAGKIDVSRVKARDVSMECDVGAIRFEGSVDRHGYADVDIGKIEIGLTEGQESDYNYSIENDVGRVFVGDKNYDGLSVDERLDNGADKDWELRCDVGYVALSFR